MGFSPLENLKHFTSTRPPLVVFMICMLTFAVTAMSLAYFVKSNEIRNPDIVDWNMFLDKFAAIDFCIQHHHQPQIHVNGSQQRLQKELPFPLSTAGLSYTTEEIKNYSVSLVVEVSTDFNSLLHNVTHMHGVIVGRHLGLSGEAAKENVTVTFELPAGMKKDEKLKTCVTFMASSTVFPFTKAPENCLINQSDAFYQPVTIEGLKLPLYPRSNWCNNGTKVFVQYTDNPHLTVYLTLSDRSLVNLHLMHTSYFLFIMVMTLLAYALLRGRPKNFVKNGVLVNEKIPLEA